MKRIILVFIALFFSSLSFAFEEVCLNGDTATYKFGVNQLPENLSLPNTEYDSIFSACNAAVSIYNSLLDSNGQKYYAEVKFYGVQNADSSAPYCDVAHRKWGMTTELEHDFIILSKTTEQKDCSCNEGFSRDFNGRCVATCPNGSTWDGTKCVLTSCPVGQHVEGTRCVDDKKPVEQCPDGQYRGDDNFCHELPPECAPDEVLQGGKCIKKPTDCNAEIEDCGGLDVCDPKSKLFFICNWYHDWSDWWNNEYANNEQQGRDDREKIKTSLDQVKQQDSEFYEEIRKWLQEKKNGSPSENFPIVQFPPFCEWSKVVCDWYLDYKDFTQEIRDFMDKYNQNIDQNKNPLEPDKDPYQIKEQDDVSLGTTQYFQSAEGCPPDRIIPIEFNGYTSEIKISYQPLCNAAVMFKPFVILMSFLAGMFIITNTGRRAETGD